MKKLSLLAVVLTALVFTACEQGALFNEDEINTDELTAAADLAAYDAISETIVSTSFEEVDEATDESIELFFGAAGSTGGRMIGYGDGYGYGKGHEYGNLERIRTDCAEVTRDTVTQTITIDFGDGCEDARGVLKSGKIIIQYDGMPRNPGSYRIVTFEDFYLDSIRIDGVRTVTNATDTAATDNMEVFETTLEGGMLTFTDNTTITRDAAHVRTRYRGETREESYITLTGAAYGQLQDGTEYTATILEEILISGACNLHVPVSGVKEFVAGETTITIDFGDGTCDNLAEVTTNGETEIIELESRREFRDNHRGGRDRHGRGGRHGHDG